MVGLFDEIKKYVVNKVVFIMFDHIAEVLLVVVFLDHTLIILLVKMALLLDHDGSYHIWFVDQRVTFQHSFIHRFGQEVGNS